MKRRQRISNKPLAYTAILLSLIFFTALPAMAGGSVDVTVDISPKLQAGTKPEQVVYIFAKAVRGPKAPLAVVKSTVSNLPISVKLDDSKSVVPFLKISNYDAVRIEARISKSGGVRKISGDLEGISPVIKTDNAVKPVHLHIDHVVK